MLKQRNHVKKLLSSFAWSLERLFASTSANSVELHSQSVILRPGRIHLKEGHENKIQGIKNGYGNSVNSNLVFSR